VSGVVRGSVAAAFAGTGAAFWVAPAATLGVFGAAPLTDDGVVEIMAFYGALELGLAAFMAAAVDADVALRLAGTMLGSCAVGRVAAIASGAAIAPRPPAPPRTRAAETLAALRRSVHGAVALAEFTGAVVCWFALARELRAKRAAAAERNARARRQPPNASKLADFVAFAPENVQNPWPFYRALREEAPVYKPAGLDYYLVSRAEHVQAVCRDPEHFSSNLVQILLRSEADALSTTTVNVRNISGSGVVDVLALQDPPRHTVQRRIAQAGLTPKLFASMDNRIRELARSLIAAFAAEVERGADAGADFMDAVALRLPMAVALDLCAFPSDADTARRIKSLADDTVLLMSASNTPDRFAELIARGFGLFSWIVEQYRAQVRALPSASDLINSLAAATEGGELSEAEAHSVILQILLAGNDSSASTMGSAMRVLCERPDVVQELRGNAAMIAAFVEEVLRYESPFTGHFRKVTADVELAGVQLRRGDRVMLLWGSANRDERVFERPDEFVVGRFAGRTPTHVAFGFGIHSCLGAPLARREVRIVVEELLGALAEMRPAGAHLAAVRPYYIDNTFTRSLGRYHVAGRKAGGGGG